MMIETHASQGLQRVYKATAVFVFMLNHNNHIHSELLVMQDTFR